MQYNLNSINKKENLKLAYRRLVTNTEYNYKNYFRDEYDAYSLALEENLNDLRLKMATGYLPTESIRAFSPKANGLNRMYTLLSIEDQIVYQAYANIIAEAIITKTVRKRYGNTVFGNLYKDNNSDYFYEYWKESYKKFTAALEKSFISGNKYIASFDLTACYDSINHSLLKQLLIKNRVSENAANEFIRLLAMWESSNGLPLGQGIPQGPLASGIVSEVVLSQYDEYIEGLKKQYAFEYFRYVDDIKIMSKSKETARDVLYLLDLKSKQLGLFPQSSKISLHRIENIEDEVKRISKPLFDDDFSEDEKQEISIKELKMILKHEPCDLTTVKRYIKCIKPSYKANQVILNALTEYPNLIDSIAFYIQRYPRVLPNSISKYIFECCQNISTQYICGILLESASGNFNATWNKKIYAVAKECIKNKMIRDPRLKAQYILMLKDNRFIANKTFEKYYKNSNWWIKKEILSKSNSDIDKIILKEVMSDDYNDLALIASQKIVLDSERFQLPTHKNICPISQNILKATKIISRGSKDVCQINKYLSTIVAKNMGTFTWKKFLGKEAIKLETKMYVAENYFNSDLTAFVNIWDTIDDMLCNIACAKYRDKLCGYTLGNFGSIEAKNLKNELPEFQKMLIYIHSLRLDSQLSHAVISKKGCYTGPIPTNERKKIQKMIEFGIKDLIAFVSKQ